MHYIKLHQITLNYIKLHYITEILRIQPYAKKQKGVAKMKAQNTKMGKHIEK